MSTYRRLRAVFQLALVSALCWGLVAVLLSLIGVVGSGRGFSAWAPVKPFLIYSFYGLIAGAAFAVFLGLRRAETAGAELSIARATAFGGVGGALVFLLVALVVPGASQGVPLKSLLGVAGTFAFVGAMTGLGIQRIAKRGALPAGPDSQKSIAP